MAEPLRPIGEVIDLRVFDLEGATIKEVGFIPNVGWQFYVAHRGCDDDAATLTVPEHGVKFAYPTEAEPNG